MRAFDLDWYRLQRPDAPEDKVPALRHFREIGALNWSSPTPLFDVSYYLRQAGPEAFDNPYDHYVSRGALAKLNPHPLVDAQAYRDCLRLANDIEVLEYGASNITAAALNPRFDRVWYEGWRRKNFVSAFDAFADYVAVGQPLGISPYPLFDPVHFSMSRPEDGRWPFERYWAERDVCKTSTFPFVEPEYLAGAQLLHSKGAFWEGGPGPVSRLLDPFEMPDSLIDFSLGSYLAQIRDDGLQPCLRQAAKVMNKSLRRRSHEATDLGVGEWEAPGQQGPAPALTFLQSAVLPNWDKLHDEKSPEVLIYAPSGLLQPRVLGYLTALAAGRGVGMVGMLGAAARPVGAYREVLVPHLGAFAIKSAVLRAMGGLDSNFVSTRGAASDLALRLVKTGYRNLDMATEQGLEPAPAADPVDAVLLFDRHNDILKNIPRPIQLDHGARP